MTGTPQLLLVHHLKTLKLPAFLREYDKLARQCAAEGAGHVRYPVRLAELELIDRERRMAERRIRQARFPAVKSLDAFDFKAIPSLNKMLVVELARCEYARGEEGDAVLPGLELRAGAHVDSNSYLVNNDWMSLGAAVSVIRRPIAHSPAHSVHALPNGQAG